MEEVLKLKGYDRNPMRRFPKTGVLEMLIVLSCLYKCICF